MEQVTISKKVYDRLIEDSNLLSCLQAAGVDNWEGYSFALEECDGDSEDEDD